MNEFARRIRQLRENAGLSQKELSYILNIERTTLASYEIGRGLIIYRRRYSRSIKATAGIARMGIISQGIHPCISPCAITYI
jgi:transcriptional regulator with XRE-family HTH domain